MTVMTIDEVKESLSDTYDVRYTALEKYRLGPFTFHLNLLPRVFCATDAASGKKWDYFYIELEGRAAFPTPAPTSIVGKPDAATLARDFAEWAIDGYELTVTPPVTGFPPKTEFELIDSAPGTTIGQTSYSTSMSTTIGGSIGLMGTSGTANFDGSISFQSGSSTAIQDVSILNQSGMDSIPLGHWQFKVAPRSLSAAGDTNLDVVALFRAPHATGDVQFRVGCAVGFRLQKGPADFFEQLARIAPGGPQLLTTMGIDLSSTNPGFTLGTDADPELCLISYGKTLTITRPDYQAPLPA